jgi:hypothetical protein
MRAEATLRVEGMRAPAAPAFRDEGTGLREQATLRVEGKRMVTELNTVPRIVPRRFPSAS